MDKEISSSKERHTFQIDAYLQRCTEDGTPPDKMYLKSMKLSISMYDRRFNSPESRESNLEYDLLTTDWILDKARNSKSYSQNLYAAICNNDFIKNDVWDILKDKKWSCSWRYAGGIVADMNQKGDYMDWYCSGIGSFDIGEEALTVTGYVPEGEVTDEIRSDLLKLGWAVLPD